MTRQMLAPLVLALVLLALAAVELNYMGNHRVLAAPGVTTRPLPDTIRLKVDLPERVMDYTSEWVDVDDITLGTLPKDTSFGERRYTAPDGFVVELRVVLMGTDRTSMHKPQICLTGQGWQIDETASIKTDLPVERPQPYNLPVVELVSAKESTIDGQARRMSSVYVYWYVANDAISASTSGLERMWKMASNLLRTGMLQRWAYVSCFSVCEPGQEVATFNRIKPFISAAVPEFQLYPRAVSVSERAAR